MDTPPVEAPAPAEHRGAPRRRRGFDPRAYRDPRPSPALIGALGWLNRLVVLPLLVRLDGVDLPRTDRERLGTAVRPGTAAFLGPNHAEFFADWMLDKELSTRMSPLMAHWAAQEIVNLGRVVQGLALRNNLIANVPGGGGRAYSIRWALAGHGVLLHPEGTTSWHADRVHALLPGIVDLAWETCRRAAGTGRSLPTLIVPLTYRMRFVGDVTRGLEREMALIERRLALPPGGGMPLEGRFAALQVHLLRRQGERLGLPVPLAPGSAPGAGYFAAQEELAVAIVRELESSGARVNRDMAWLVRRARRARRPRAGRTTEQSDRVRLLYQELWRLEGFSPAVYDAPFLTQEQVAENLKRLRSMFVTEGVGAAVQNALTVPVGRRVAHIRVAEPIPVHEAFATSAGDAERTKARLLATLHERMQRGVDGLRAELAPLVERWRRPNPLWSGRGG
jgi:hypothetical protein